MVCLLFYNVSDVMSCTGERAKNSHIIARLPPTHTLIGQKIKIALDVMLFF